MDAFLEQAAILAKSLSILLCVKKLDKWKNTLSTPKRSNKKFCWFSGRPQPFHEASPPQGQSLQPFQGKPFPSQTNQGFQHVQQQQCPPKRRRYFSRIVGIQVEVMVEVEVSLCPL